MAANKGLTPEIVADAIRRRGSQAAAADALGVNRRTLERNIARWRAAGLWQDARTEVEFPDSAEPSIDEILEARRKQFERKRRHEEQRKLIPISIKTPGPIGILFFGDPHLDDDGTDIAAIERDLQLCRDSEAIFGVCLGDVTNNWVGRLERLYAEQNTTSRQAWLLAEWFCTYIPWLFFLGGNHDAWKQGNEILRGFLRGQLFEADECRVQLRFPGGRTVNVNARHNWPGHSMWNVAHGQGKAAQMGIDDHIIIGGDKHCSGYNVHKHPLSGRLIHAIQVASYKRYDRYAREKGFADKHISPSCLVVIDPGATDETALIQTFWNTAEGAEFLAYKRSKVAA